MPIILDLTQHHKVPLFYSSCASEWCHWECFLIRGCSVVISKMSRNEVY
jgi:hypothetical protein